MHVNSIDQLIKNALAEDVGSGDATSIATVPEKCVAIATITQKEPGVLSGITVAEQVFKVCDQNTCITNKAAEGEWRSNGLCLQVAGNARAILAAERTALNFLQRLSGVATVTALCARKLAGTKTKILDTRKTTPGLRILEKAAVVHGGGVNHRFGLFDAVLIKENHITLAGGVEPAVRLARAKYPHLTLTIECRTQAEVATALAVGAQRIMLDNMSPAQVKEAVQLIAGRAETEASGGITDDNLAAYGASGVDYVSVGAITHSAPALDLSLIVTLSSM